MNEFIKYSMTSWQMNARGSYEWINKQMNERINGQMSKWMNEWMNELIN